MDPAGTAPPSPTPRSFAGRIEDLSARPYASWALFAVALVEGSVFPLPPDPLFIALSLGNPRRAFRFGAIAAAGSVLGSLLGYAIGLVLFESFGHALLKGLGVLGAFNAAQAEYRAHGVFTLIAAGFTPVPYSVLSIAAGFNRTLPLATLAVGSVLGRAIRFGILATLLALFGEGVKRFLTTHRFLLALVTVGFFVLTFAFLRLLL